jgi:DNA polymerase I
MFLPLLLKRPQQRGHEMTTLITSEDEYLFGWDPAPGIVSAWANRSGQAILWRREKHEGTEHVTCNTERFRPWLLATSLTDLAHLGSTLQAAPADKPTRHTIGITYRELEGDEGSYRFLLSAPDGRDLERKLLQGASRRLERQIKNLNELPNAYLRVGPLEQYLMQTGRVYFRGLNYEDLHRLQFDLETTALDPHRGRIFLVAVRDSRGLATTIEATDPQDEKQLIAQLCAIIRARDPDVIENHNLFGFDLPFLEHRAAVVEETLTIGRRGPHGRFASLESYQETLAIGPEARRRTRYSVAGRELIDTLDAVRRHDFVVRDMPSHGLKDVARYFNIASAFI